MSWNEGYVTEVEYTFGYYGELDPRRALYALNAAGFAAPAMGAACELGFGNGLSVTLHGAGQPNTEMWGTDFNPVQAGFAQMLGASYGGDARLFDQSFEEFCNRPDLPDFEFIGLHGIWTWISDENRKIIVDFARRKLKVGGVFYVSYNTFPGWPGMAPTRHLLKRHVDEFGAPGAPIADRAAAAIGFAEQLMAANPKYLLANPQVTERLKQIKAHDKSYIAHEYLNRDWSPIYFADMEQWLEPAKLSFACSAHMLDAIDAINLTADQRKLLNGITDRSFRETVRDICVNQQFRRDYWVKGPRRLSLPEQVDALRRQRLVLKKQRSTIEMKVTGMLGQADLHADVYDPILDYLADHKVRTFAEIEAAMAQKGLVFAQVSTALNILMGAGHIHRALEEEEVSKAKKTTAKLNDAILRRARVAADVNYLASPILGAAVPINRIGCLALLAMKEGRKTPSDWAKYVWEVLASQGQRLVKDGAAVESPEENLAELTTQMDAFAKENLPVLKALGVA